MQMFKDNEGRDWIIEINLGVRKTVKATTQVDLLDVEQVQKLVVMSDVEDLARLGDVLYALCQTQITERNLTEEQFARGLKGNTFDTARAALETEILDFFPQSQRSLLVAMLAKTRSLHQTIADKFNQQMSGMDLEKQISEKMDQMLSNLLSGSSGSSPASSASIPTP